ncbi:MAG: hypothetical protein ACREFQ_15595, partial [Stellaceae bacterium]
EQRFDEIEPALTLISNAAAKLGLPVRTLEVEYGPSQCEMTFRPGVGLDPADWMMLFRSAAKQVCRRHGYHATFMCRPQLDNIVSSGWHLHQSLRARSNGANVFVGEGERLSPLARSWLGGLLTHAAGAAALTTPTINGYKRYAPYSLAPERANWGHDNRGVMVRAVGIAGDPATHLENRVGEPAANPYLYLASQVLSGRDGMARRLDPGPSADSPYAAEWPLLPHSLSDALAALEADAALDTGLGPGFVPYYCRIKEAEITRFNQTVSDWEQREYFEMF